MASSNAENINVTNAGAGPVDDTSRAHQVLRNPELLTHILSFVDEEDEKTWRSVFTVEKAWLPAVTQLRCREASWEVMSWESDTVWRQCVANSIRSISHTDWTKGYDVAEMDSKTCVEVDEAFVKFPLLRSVERSEVHEYRQTTKASAAWTYDPTTGKREVALHYPIYRTLRGHDGNTDVDTDGHTDEETDADMIVDSDGDTDVDADVNTDAHSMLTQLASSAWKVRRTTSVVLRANDDPLGHDTYPGLKDSYLPSHVTDLVLPYVTVDMSDLIDICRTRSKNSHASPLVRLEGSLVFGLDPESFRLLGQTAGKHLLHIHLYDAWHDLSDPPEVMGVTTIVTFALLWWMVEIVRLHFTRLQTLTIPIEHADEDGDLSAALPEPVNLDTACPRPLHAIVLLICSGRSGVNGSETELAWPLLGIARNLAYIADGDTAIECRHWDKSTGVWTNRPDEAEIIMDVIRFIRSLPKRHTNSLLVYDLDTLGIEPNDHASFLRTAFDPVGRPVIYEVQLARQRYITIEKAWRDADEPPDANAQAELNRLRQELEDFDQWSPGWGIDQCVSADDCQITRQALKRAEAEIQRLKAKLAELELH